LSRLSALHTMQALVIGVQAAGVDQDVSAGGPEQVAIHLRVKVLPANAG
jgi:hypothetical protein